MRNARLDAVMKAKQAYALAKTSLENKLREQLYRELANLQTQIDIAIRIAYNDGESKADILRALGTKDYNTVNLSLERTNGVNEIVGENPLDSVYSIEDNNVLTVRYENHGPKFYSGEARFTIKKLPDGGYLLLSLDSMWNEDYTVRNDVVACLDQQKDGFYYEEACEWISQRD